MNAMSFRGICTQLSPKHTCHSILTDWPAVSLLCLQLFFHVFFLKKILFLPSCSKCQYRCFHPMHLDPCRRLSSRVRALWPWACFPSALQIMEDASIHHLSGLRLKIDLRLAELQDLRFVCVMQFRAKTHHVAVFIEKFVICHFPHKFGLSLTPRDSRFLMSSSSFKVDCSRSPDAWALGFWDSLRPDEDDAFCCSLWQQMGLFPCWRFKLRDFCTRFASGLPVPGHQGNAIDRTMPGLGSRGLSHRIVSFLEQRSVVGFSDVALRPVRSVRFLGFDDAPSNFETSPMEWRVLFAILWASGTNAATTEMGCCGLDYCCHHEQWWYIWFHECCERSHQRHCEYWFGLWGDACVVDDEPEVKSIWYIWLSWSAWSIVRGSCSARVPRSSLTRVHRAFVHHILEDEVDGQEEGQDDKREDGVQREESGVVEESQNKHMRMTHDARMTNTRLEPRMCV